ncbi:MAG: phosphoenolpyruvate--protein phosphotransferase [Pseudomonadota bacterium]
MLDALRSIVQHVNDATSFREALDIVVAEVAAAMGTEVCSVYLRDDAARFVFAANEGLNRDVVGQVTLGEREGLVALVGQRAEPLNLQDATVHPRFHFLPEIGEEPFHAFLGVPVIHQRQVLGVLVVQQRDRRRFDEAEEAFLVTLSAQLAAAVAHAEATGEARDLFSPEVEHSDSRYRGVPGAPGIATGRVVVVQPPADLDAVPDRQADDVTVELLVFDRALDAVRADIARIGEQLPESVPSEERALFDAYLHMLDDTALGDDVRERIRGGHWAQGALRRVIVDHVRRFEEMEDSYLRERAADVRELGQRVLAYLQDIRSDRVRLPEDCIVVGHEISAGMLAEFPVEQLRGIVSMRGSGTSHVAILARSLGVPTVMGAVDLPIHSLDGQTLIVDGFYGEVVANPSRDVSDSYDSLMQQEREFDAELEELRDAPSETEDGHRIRLWCNIGLSGDISRSLDLGAEGIGLFRTEIPFMTEERFPTEEEQRQIYRSHMAAFEPRPVTMRTLDIGGDKALSYFPISEDNPFLGWRGIRVTLDHPEIFLIQARAMIKANAGLDGVLRIMLPMISSMAEVEEARELVERAFAEVVEEGFKVKPPEIGVMVEVPAAVFQAREIAKRVDFLAVGSNDLTQYMLAVDRNNPRVADLYQDMHPAVIQALRQVARSGHAERKPVGICGEFAGTPTGAVLLVGMGYDVLSMNAINLPRIKWVIRNITLRRARRMLSHVLRMDDSEEIQMFMHEQLQRAGLGRAVPSHRLVPGASLGEG